MTMKRKYRIVAILAPILIFMDQFTKFIVIRKMFEGQSIPVIDGFLSWHYLTNPGAAFGMFRHLPDSFRSPFFILISFTAIGIIFYYLAKSEDHKVFFPVSLSFVISGAMGNLTDRIRLGHVTDFILVEATFFGERLLAIIDRWPGTRYWPSFNVADSLIVAGIFGMAFDLLFNTPMEEAGEPEKKPKDQVESSACGCSGASEIGCPPSNSTGELN